MCRHALRHEALEKLFKHIASEIVKGLDDGSLPFKEFHERMTKEFGDLEPYQRVLARVNGGVWHIEFFEEVDFDCEKYAGLCRLYDQCVPYCDVTKKLLCTDDDYYAADEENSEKADAKSKEKGKENVNKNSAVKKPSVSDNYLSKDIERGDFIEVFRDMEWRRAIFLGLTDDGKAVKAIEDDSDTPCVYHFFHG